MTHARDDSSFILDSLARGEVIVCDRYAFSGIAFTAAKSRLSSSSVPVPLPTLAAPDAGLPLPDLTIFLSISTAVQAERGGFGAERYEKAEMQDAVRKVFEGEGGVAEMVRRRHGEGRWVTVDADGSSDEVADRIFAAVEPLLSLASSADGAAAPVARLWEA